MVLHMFQMRLWTIEIDKVLPFFFITNRHVTVIWHIPLFVFVLVWAVSCCLVCEDWVKLLDLLTSNLGSSFLWLFGVLQLGIWFWCRIIFTRNETRLFQENSLEFIKSSLNPQSDKSWIHQREKNPNFINVNNEFLKTFIDLIKGTIKLDLQENIF